MKYFGYTELNKVIKIHFTYFSLLLNEVTRKYKVAYVVCLSIERCCSVAFWNDPNPSIAIDC